MTRKKSTNSLNEKSLIVDNYQTNANLISQGHLYEFHYFFIETPYKFQQSFTISSTVTLYLLQELDWDMHDSSSYSWSNKKIGPVSFQELKPTIEKTLNRDESNHIYLIVIKVVSLCQSDSKIKSVSSLPPIQTTSPYDICSDVLNILSWYFHEWFILISKLFLWHSRRTLNFVKSSHQIVKLNQISKDLINNLTKLCELREEQFKFFQKSVLRLNQSLKIVNDDIELALVILVSSIENFAQLYGFEKDEFDSQISFYQKLYKIVYKMKKDTIKDGHNDELFHLIG